MFCTYCGGELREGSEFCTKCGQRISQGYVPQPVREQKGARVDYAEPIQIRCANCNEIIGGESSQPLNNCPYCGSRQGLNIAVAPDIRNGYTGQTAMPGSYGGDGRINVGIPWIFGNRNKRRHPTAARIVGVALILFGFACTMIGNLSGESGREEIVWPQSGLSQMIPEIGDTGQIYQDGSDAFSAKIYDVSKYDYSNYVEECRSSGFDVDVVNNYGSFYAYDAEGYKLTLDYYESGDELNIRVSAPIAMRKIKPADKGLAGLLPELPSDMGYIDTETESFMNFYVGEVTREQYEEFVTSCIQSGFNNEYSRIGDYFCGENADGVSLTVQYAGNSIIQITMGK